MMTIGRAFFGLAVVWIIWISGTRYALEKQFSFAKTYFPYKICNVKQGNICGEES